MQVRHAGNMGCEGDTASGLCEQPGWYWQLADESEPPHGPFTSHDEAATAVERHYAGVADVVHD